MPALAPQPSRSEQLLLFARNFFKHPRMLGSLIPSSRFLINQVLGQIDWERARVVVEYGPGVGTFTSEILRRLPQDGLLLVLETNAEFVEFLRSSLPDPRLRVVHGSASDVERHLQAAGVDRADYIISGIPFSTMPQEVRESILRSTREALRPNGAFLVYQFSPKVQPYLESEFGEVQRGFELLNVLPAQLFFCTP
jgi:phospholipid N-methyltransferase